MNRWRVSIAMIMGLVLVCAVGLAGLANATFYWAWCAHTAALGLLLAATLGALAMRGDERWQWVGMALFGWSYYVLSLWAIPWFHSDPMLPPYLATEALEGLHPYIGPKPVPVAPPIPGSPTSKAAWGQVPVRLPAFRGPNWIPFRQMSNSLGVILFALTGGLVGKFFAARARRSAR